jgi:Ni/Fe-hydrogenase subunit HybB-like protein
MTTYVEQPVAVPAVRPRVMTQPFRVLLLLGAIGVALIAWRFAVGLGRSTALSDGYPWGIWIAFDVVTGTALACGGYAMALLVYIFNKGQYHPLVRPAIVTSALGYTLGGLSVAIDVGRPWYLWKVPTMVWKWNGNSALLEVAVCIMAYIVVLWLELAPMFLERFKQGSNAGLRNFADRTLPFFNKALIWIVGFGMILPTMHQSSLGALMMLAGPRLHPLWNSNFLPLFFLLTCLAMGFAMVVFETSFSSVAFKERPPMTMLWKLGQIAAYASLAFVFWRFIDLGMRGVIGEAFRFDLYGTMFWIENVLFIAPFLMIVTRRNHVSLGTMLRAAMLVAVAGAVYRFDTFLVALQPGPGWHYFPSITEQLITVGLVALEIAAYIAIVKNFPILRGRTTAAPSIAH